MAGDGENHTHKSFSEVLGALGPGGTASMDFEDHDRLFGHPPTEDEIEGQRAHQFAKSNNAKISVDHSAKRVIFWKR